MGYFSDDEYRCKCGCGKLLYNDDFMQRLNKLRQLYAKPMHINSGYRCEAYQAKLASEGYPVSDGTSWHTLARAADIACTDSAMLYEMIHWAIMSGMTGIGISVSHGFLHLDSRPAPSICWVYK